MIDLYTWTTPNGRKASIALEELGLDYEVKAINIGKEEQFAPEFLKIAPNNKIPAIVDHDAPGGPMSLFESGAILVYLAEKTGKLLAPSGPARYAALEWTFWQMANLGPMLGQLGFFVMRSKDKPPEAIERFTTESHRLFQVMETRLKDNAYLAGADYSRFAASGVPAHAMADLSLALLNGEIARVSGDLPDAVARFKMAADIEQALPYSEPPYWHQPTSHLLGAALLQARRPAEAEAVYRQSLKTYRADGWALYGLAQALDAQGKAAEAAQVRQAFAQTWKFADVTLTSSRF